MAFQRTITQADLDANPILAELAGAVGDVVAIHTVEQTDQADQSTSEEGQ